MAARPTVRSRRSRKSLPMISGSAAAGSHTGIRSITSHATACLSNTLSTVSTLFVVPTDRCPSARETLHGFVANRVQFLGPEQRVPNAHSGSSLWLQSRMASGDLPSRSRRETWPRTVQALAPPSSAGPDHASTDAAHGLGPTAVRRADFETNARRLSRLPGSVSASRTIMSTNHPPFRISRTLTLIANSFPAMARTSGAATLPDRFLE